MALALHLAHPPPRTASLQRSKQTRFLSNEKHTSSTCSLLTAFLSTLEFSTVSSPSPTLTSSDWPTLAQDDMMMLDLDFPASPSLEDDIPLPSTPSTPRFFARLFPDSKSSWESEVDDIDIDIPLMTSLFYDDGGCALTFPRDRPNIHLRRGKQIPSQSFPTDVESWYCSPSPTPRSTTPQPSMEVTSTDSPLPTTTEPIQPLSVAQELLRFHSRRRKQVNQSPSPRRRLPQPPTLTKNNTIAKETLVKGAQSQATTTPTKPKTRPLPPTPLSTSTLNTKPATKPLGGSFLSLSSPSGTLDDRMSLGFDGLVDVVDDMISNQRLSSFTIGEIISMDPVLPLRRRL